MNNPFRTDRDHDRGRWTEQGQDGGQYDAGSRPQQSGQDWGRDRSQDRTGAYAQGQGGHDQNRGGDWSQGRGSTYGQFNQSSPSGETNRGGTYGGSAFSSGDDRNSRSGGQGSYYGQADMGGTGYDDDRSRMSSSGWNAGQSHQGRASPYGQGAYGQGRQSQGPHHDFEPDYLHWREQQMSNYDRDYTDWRNEKRQKFSSDFEGWRSSRGPAVQAENSVVGDVSDGGVGSQTHAKDLHEDKAPKH